MPEKTVKRRIKAVGNSAMIPFHKTDLEDLGAQIGSSVQVTIRTLDDNYDKTRDSAFRMRHRFARTLELLGK